MGIMRQYHLSCDKCFSYYGDDWGTPVMLEQEAFADGWVWDSSITRLGRQFPTGGYSCPACAER